MQQDSSQPGLYGLTSDNSSRVGDDLWGKNQFNSTFPLALCLYMRDNGHRPVSVNMTDGKVKVVDPIWSMDDIIGKASDKPYYHFEKSYEPFEKYSREGSVVDKIDLVVEINGEHFAPYEIKLTVIPDITTVKRSEKEWAPEMVVRPVSSAHAMMRVASSLLDENNKYIADQIRSILRIAYNKIRKWDSKADIYKNSEALYSALDQALIYAEEIQSPFLIQPIWKTCGQTLKLCEKCFDVFVWSDVAVMGIPVRECNIEAARESRFAPRILREIARHVRALYDILQNGDYAYPEIYKGMDLDKQTDKAFAISGNRSFIYMSHERLCNPVLPRTVIKEIVVNGGASQLRPERRFDAAVQAYMGN